MKYTESVPILSGTMRILVPSVMLILAVLCPVSYMIGVGNHPLSLAGVTAITAILLLLAIYSVLSKITITVNDTGIRINRMFIPADNIATCKVVDDVQPYRKYGGVGIRRSPSGKGYISSGIKTGIIIERKNGSSVVVTSEHPEKILECCLSIKT